MTSIGVRQLKAQASSIRRRVRERGESIDVTYRGRVVARLVPAELPAASPEDLRAAWADLDELAVEIGAHWPPGVSAVEAVREGRRAL